MKYEKTLKYNTDLINQKIMGPNPLKLEIDAGACQYLNFIAIVLKKK